MASVKFAYFNLNETYVLSDFISFAIMANVKFAYFNLNEMYVLSDFVIYKIIVVSMQFSHITCDILRPQHSEYKY